MTSIKGLRRRVTERRRLAKDIQQARAIDIDDVRAVGLFLGPYRNLTTLTASVLFLHPHCQVLNHAGRSVFDNDRIDFLARFEPARLDTFLRYAVQASAGGQRGSIGGSITHSHAFTDEYKTREIFEASGVDLVKTDIRALVWKESLATANHIRHHGTDLDAMFEADPRPRFLLPVRHPVDAAVSNVEKGFAKRFDGLPEDASVEQVVDAILDEYLWVMEARAGHPERFHVFFEHDAGRSTLTGLADFLELEPLESWLDGAGQAFDVKSRYDHPAALLEHYRLAVEKRFTDHPDFGAQLLRFVDTP